MKKTYLVLCLGLFFFQSLVRAEIWGVKSHDPVSEPPATLFKFNEDGTGFEVIGVITLNGEQIDVDGLALSADDVLYGFQVGIGGSRLITIDKVSAEATVVGGLLTGRDIRGATFDHLGRLITLNAGDNSVLEINPDTGAVIGGRYLFNYSTGDFDVTNITDITERSDGAFVLIGPNTRSFWLYVGSSKVHPLYTDAQPGPDGFLLGMAGLATSDLMDSPETLVVYDVSGDDDLYTHQMDQGYERQTLLADIINSYDAGRGDLAAPPITVTANLVTNGGFEEGPASVGNHLHLPAGSTELTGWEILQGAIDIFGEWEHGDGERSLDLNGSPGAGAIAQEINTMPGRMYRVRFKMAANTDVQPRISRMRVQTDDASTIQEFNNAGLGIWNMGWCPRVWYFEAEDTTTVLTFTSLDESTPYYGPTLDSVEVNRVNYIIPVDLDNDCYLDVDDLVLLLNRWLTECGDEEWDENVDLAEPGDGRIDLRDFLILAENWLKSWCA